MEKKTIGFKKEITFMWVVLVAFAGAVAVAGGLLFFLFVMDGAIGGAIGGGLVGGGGYAFIYAFKSKNLPYELVRIDERNVYLPHSAIAFHQIKNVSYKGNDLTIRPMQGKPIIQGHIKNCAECYRQIVEAMGDRTDR